MDLTALSETIKGLIFHPAFVHFPIAFFFLEMGLLVGWLTQGDQSYHFFSEMAFELGYKFMLVTMMTGFLAAGGFNGLTGNVARHFHAAIALFLFYTVRRYYARKADVHTRYYTWLQLAGSIFGCVLLTCVALYGVKLVYR